MAFVQPAPVAVKLKTPSGRLAPGGAPAGAVLSNRGPETVQFGGAPICTAALPPTGRGTTGWLHTWGVAETKAEAVPHAYGVGRRDRDRDREGIWRAVGQARDGVGERPGGGAAARGKTSDGVAGDGAAAIASRSAPGRVTEPSPAMANTFAGAWGASSTNWVQRMTEEMFPFDPSR